MAASAACACGRRPAVCSAGGPAPRSRPGKPLGQDSRQLEQVVQRLRATADAPTRPVTPADPVPGASEFVTPEEERLYTAEQLVFLVRKRKAAAGLGPIMPEASQCAGCAGIGTRVCHQCGGSGVNDRDMDQVLFQNERGLIIQNNGLHDVRHFFREGFCCWLCKGKAHVGCADCGGTGIEGGVDRYTGD